MLKSELLEKLRYIVIDTYIDTIPPKSKEDIYFYNGTELKNKIIVNTFSIPNDPQENPVDILLTAVYTRGYKTKVVPDNDINLRHKLAYTEEESFHVRLKDGIEIVDDLTNEVLTKEQLEGLIKNNTDILIIKQRGID